MWNLLTDRKFAGGVFAGILLCLVALTPAFVKIKHAADLLLVASQTNRAALDSCTAKLADAARQAHIAVTMDFPRR